MDSFKEICKVSDISECPFITDIKLLYMLLLAFSTCIFIILAPLIPKIGHHIPAALIAIIIGTFLNEFLLETDNVGN